MCVCSACVHVFERDSEWVCVCACMCCVYVCDRDTECVFVCTRVRQCVCVCRGGEKSGGFSFAGVHDHSTAESWLSYTDC